MTTKKAYKLDLATVLNAIDRQDLEFYSGLSDEEKKSYVPLILMKYMSSLTDQSKNTAYAVLATNDLINIGFWNLSKHPELQHKLLCLAGLGKKQYRPWISGKKSHKNSKIHNWLNSFMPEANELEIEIFLSKFDKKSWLDFLNSSGLTDSEVKELASAFKSSE